MIHLLNKNAPTHMATSHHERQLLNGCSLFPGDGGLYQVDQHTMRLIKSGSVVCMDHCLAARP